MKKHIMFLHVLKAINHMVLLALSYFRYFFLLSTDIFLTQFWTGKLLIHKPQPRLNQGLQDSMCYGGEANIGVRSSGKVGKVFM